MDGLKQAEAAFKLQYEVTARGMSRAYWSDNADKVADVCGKGWDRSSSKSLVIEMIR